MVYVLIPGMRYSTIITGRDLLNIDDILYK